MMPMLALAACLCGQPAAEETEWVRAHSFEFATAEAGRGFADLEPLRAMVGKARIVSLGEPTHGTREAFQMKHRLLEFLATEMGFTIFSIEANMPEAYRLNDYVLRGEGNPRGLIRGMYFWTWDTEEVLAMVEWMRSFNASGAGRVQFTGFDMQTETVAHDNARAFLKEADPEFVGEADRAFRESLRAGSTPRDGGFGVCTGSFPTALAKGRHLVYSGMIRTKDLEGFAGLWWRADGADGKVLAFDNMSQRGPRGTTGWTRYAIELDVPPETTDIAFGVIAPATGGTAWFDGLSIELDRQTFRDPESFDLDFESGQFVGLRPMNPRFKTAIVAEEPASGKFCVRMDAPAAGAGAGEEKAVSAAEARRLVEGVLAHMEGREAEYKKARDAWDVDWAIQNARVAAQCARLKAMMDEKRADKLMSRDYAMAQNVQWILDHNPGQKIVLWAHNGHVGREEWAMGGFLEERMPGRQVVVGFATSRGRYQAIGDGGLRNHDLQEPPPDSLEAVLESAGRERLIVDLRPARADDPASAWLTRPTNFRMIGALAMERQFVPRPIHGTYDLIVYQRRTTAARSLGQVMPNPGD